MSKCDRCSNKDRHYNSPFDKCYCVTCVNLITDQKICKCILYFSLIDECRHYNNKHYQVDWVRAIKYKNNVFKSRYNKRSNNE